MKEQLIRTKIVLRHLPPTISRDTLVEHVDRAFAGRYHWLTFYPGKTSHKHQSYSRAYIDFNKPEDVVEFSEFFNGHVFVNEKGTQFKTIVEYAPSQRVPSKSTKKDAREGTIMNDPEYMEFLESLAKPVASLPSAEIQLERREAEKAGAAKDAPIVTPLMDFVRQKRATKGVGRRGSSNGRPGRRASGSSGSANNSVSKRSSDRKRTSVPMYVLRDSNKSKSGKEKITALPEGSRDETGPAVTDGGKKKVLLLKGKEKEIPHFSRNMSHQQNQVTPVKDIVSGSKEDQHHESGGRMIRGILINKNSRQGHISGVSSEPRIQILNPEKEKRPPRPSHFQLVVKESNGSSDDRVGSDMHSSEKHEKRTRSRDRPDRGIWTLRRSEGLHASDESLSSSASQASQPLLDSEGYEVVRIRGDVKSYVTNIRAGDAKNMGGGRIGRNLENGSYKHGRRGPHSLKDVDGAREGKPLKRVGSREKQVWVQKSSTG